MENYERELRMGMDIRKSGKGNGICRKNEKDTRRGRSSIKKSIGGDETTSGQGKKRGRRMENR